LLEKFFYLLKTLGRVEQLKEISDPGIGISMSAHCTQLEQVYAMALRPLNRGLNVKVERRLCCGVVN
jgi:hypothetical protein